MVGTPNEEPKWREAYTNPNFYVDAARIYISQKTDIDKNFGIGKEFAKTKTKALDGAGAPGEEEIGQYGAASAIAIKADNVRLIARTSMRLVTGTDKFNSQGGEASGKHGIEIIAMNRNDQLQPMVLGDNLVEVLRTIVGAIEQTMNIFEAQLHYQMLFNKAVAKHDHTTHFFAKVTLPSVGAMLANTKCGVTSMIKTELSCMSHVANLKGAIVNYLTNPGGKGGKPKFILSPHNKVN